MRGGARHGAIDRTDIVELMGGTILLQNEIGKGTSNTVLLPLTPALNETLPAVIEEVTALGE